MKNVLNVYQGQSFVVYVNYTHTASIQLHAFVTSCLIENNTGIGIENNTENIG